MSRVFTMRRCCRFCSSWFTINGSNHWFCGHGDCTSRRRKADRLAEKARKAPKPNQYQQWLAVRAEIEGRE